MSSKNQSIKQSTMRKIPKIQPSSTARVIIIQEDITDVSCSAQTNLHGAETHRFIHQNRTATIRGVSGFGSDSAGFPHHASIRRDRPSGTTMEPFYSNTFLFTLVRQSLEAPIAWKVVTHHVFNFVFLFDKKYKYLWCTKISQVICYK